MDRYWAIAPFFATEPEGWETVWRHCLSRNVISIGWSELNDVTGLSRDALLKRIHRTYPDYSDAKATEACGMLWHFYHSIQPGHTVIARRGTKMIAAVGTVMDFAYYDPLKYRKPYLPYHFPNHLDVEWHDESRNISFSEPVFGIQTLHEVSTEKFQALTVGDRIDVEGRDLSDAEIDSLLKANRLRIGVLPTDSPVSLTRQRRGQARLRRLTIKQYGGKCAVCDVTESDLLVASHIVGWAASPEHRGNLANVICLCKFHDALFEVGYWSLTDDFQIVKVSGKKYAASSGAVRSVLDRIETFRRPTDYPPDLRFCAKHRRRCGLPATTQ